MKRLPLVFLATLTLAGCGGLVAALYGFGEDPIDPEVLRGGLAELSSDEMEGRRTGTPGSLKAAEWIEDMMDGFGLEPAGDEGFAQIVPLVRGENGRWRLAESVETLDTVPEERRHLARNLIGILPGTDSLLKDEVVLVTAHYDHVGIGRAVNGDSIYNGADDNASGTLALLLIAGRLEYEGAAKRTIIFAAMTGEEIGMLGTRWYLAHPVRSLERTVANFNIEMIGRPDSLAGGFGKAWLTGYERSTMGDALAANGIPIVPDPRPDQNFFRRSDNYAFARIGIPAHTLSSFNLHGDYHRPSDEVSRTDPAHMAQVISAAGRAVRLLADGPKPEWKPGGRPEN